MPSKHLILCHLLFLLLWILSSIRDFSMSQFFVSVGQSIGVSAPPSVLPMNIHDWFPLGLTDLIFLLFKALSRVFLQHHCSRASILHHLGFFMKKLSYLYMTIGRTIALTLCTFVGNVMSLLFNTLSRFVLGFLPKSMHPLISWLQSSDFGAQENKVCHSIFSPSRFSSPLSSYSHCA